MIIHRIEVPIGSIVNAAIDKLKNGEDKFRFVLEDVRLKQTAESNVPTLVVDIKQVKESP